MSISTNKKIIIIRFIIFTLKAFNISLINIWKYINSSIDKLDKKTSELIQILDNNYTLDINNDKYEDYYDDIKTRIQKYSQIINKYKLTVADIIKKNGNIDKIKELLEIFDSKNKKNKNLIFQQNFFQNEIDRENITPRLPNNCSKESEKKLNNCKSNSLLCSKDYTDNKDNNNNLKVNKIHRNNLHTTI